MWNDPHRLNQLSVWLLLATGVFAGILATRSLTEQLFPLREVTVFGAGQAETRQAVGQVIYSLKGGFFTLDLDAARIAFEGLPWVRQATVRRIWPDRLVVEVEEHVPAAAWNGQEMLNVQGERFPVRPWPGLPRIYAPEGSEREVARRLKEFQALLDPAGWRIETLQFSPRGAWRLTLEDSLAKPTRPRVSLELGRERLTERVQRFVAYYPAAVERVGPLTQIDLRYPNGFAAKVQKTLDKKAKTPSEAARTGDRGPRVARTAATDTPSQRHSTLI